MFYQGYETHRFWKHLGLVHPALDVVYAMDDVNGDLDPDREAELRAQVMNVVTRVTTSGYGITEYSTAAIHDFPRRGRSTVVGFTSRDVELMPHIYRTVARPRN